MLSELHCCNIMRTMSSQTFAICSNSTKLGLGLFIFFSIFTCNNGYTISSFSNISQRWILSSSRQSTSLCATPKSSKLKESKSIFSCTFYVRRENWDNRIYNFYVFIFYTVELKSIVSALVILWISSNPHTLISLSDPIKETLT